MRSLRDESPCCVSDEGSELADDGDLLLAVQGARVRKNLQPYVGAVSLYVRVRPVQEVVDECRGVPTEYRDIRNPFDLHQCGGQVTRQGFAIRDSPACRVCVDHGHGILPLFAAED